VNDPTLTGDMHENVAPTIGSAAVSEVPVVMTKELGSPPLQVIGWSAPRFTVAI
jgi:hypothetical protein